MGKQNFEIWKKLLIIQYYYLAFLLTKSYSLLATIHVQYVDYYTSTQQALKDFDYNKNLQVILINQNKAQIYDLNRLW